MVARANVSQAFQAHFGEEKLEQFTGDCTGFSTVWMRLHDANPAAHPADRVNTLTSYEGAVQANAYHSAYRDGIDSIWTTGKRAALLHIRHEEDKAGTFQAHAAQSMDARYKIGKHVNSHSDVPVAKIGKALTETNGYASVRIIFAGESSGHAVAVHHVPGARHLTLFDSQQGEFHVPTNQAQEFMQAFVQRYKDSGNGTISHFDLAPVSMGGPIEQTSLAGLAAGVKYTDETGRG